MSSRQEAASLLLGLIETMYPQDVLTVVATAAARGALPLVEAGELAPDEAWSALSEFAKRGLDEALALMRPNWDVLIAQKEFATSAQEGIDNIERLLGPA